MLQASSVPLDIKSFFLPPSKLFKHFVVYFLKYQSAVLNGLVLPLSGV